MIDLLEVEELLKTRSLQQVADGLDMPHGTLRNRLRMFGTDIPQIRLDYAIEVLTKLSGTCSYAEMSRQTGFSPGKVRRFAREYGIKSTHRDVSDNFKVN